jgi:hypothetical protein
LAVARHAHCLPLPGPPLHPHPQVVAKLISATGHLSRAAGYASRPSARWVASLLGPTGLPAASFTADTLAVLLVGLAKLRTVPDAAWMRAVVLQAAKEMPRMRPRVGTNARGSGLGLPCTP